jgi:hypothetical protein
MTLCVFDLLIKKRRVKIVIFTNYAFLAGISMTPVNLQ